MAEARLSFIIGLILHLLQNSVLGQQCGLANNINVDLTSNLAATDPRVAGLISNAVNNYNCGNMGCSTNSPQSDKPTLTGLQQFLSLQQQHAPLNLQMQPLCGTVQPALVNKDPQQSLSIQPQLNLQPTSNNILQQSVNSQSANQNLQQCLNLQQMQAQIPQQLIDLQQLQNLQEAQNLQQLVLQQQSFHPIPLNLPMIEQQTPVRSEHPLSSLPIINGQLDGLPSQVSEGVLLSNLGLTSNLPSILSNRCSKPVEQVFIPQNNVASLSNIPVSVYDTQTINTVPISITAQCSPAECTKNIPSQQTSVLSISSSNPQSECVKSNPSQLQSALFPINFQNQAPSAVYQSKPCDTVFNPETNIQFQSTSYQACPNQGTVQSDQIQTQPIQTQPVQVQSAPTQPVQKQPNTVQYVPTSSVQRQSAQGQPIPRLPHIAQCDPTQLVQGQQNTVQCTATQPVEAQYTNTVQNPSQYQPSSLESLLMSQFQSSNSAQQYPNNQSPYPSSSSYGSKSSSMKALLPLLLNLLKEKNMGGYGYPPNCNCDYMNNCNGPDFKKWYPGMNNDYNNSVPQHPMIERENNENDKNNEPVAEPEITEGYSKQTKHGQSKLKQEMTNNSIELNEEIEDLPKRGKQKNKYQSKKKIKNESLEYEDDYEDSYENED